MNLLAIARSLGGEVYGRQILAPGVGHSRRDRSLSIRLDSRAPGGLLVHSFAGDDPLVAKDHLRSALGLKSGTVSDLPWIKAAQVEPPPDERTARAVALWREARDPARKRSRKVSAAARAQPAGRSGRRGDPVSPGLPIRGRPRAGDDLPCPRRGHR